MELGILNLALGVLNLGIAIRREKEGKEAPLNWIAAYSCLTIGACSIMIKFL